MPFAVRSALRALARRPALAVTVVATLTLGIGANSAIFSAVDAVLLKPLPYPEADRLVAVYESNAARRQSTALVAPARLEEWNQLNRTFVGLAATYFENMTDTSGPLPERVEGMRTSPRFFAVLGVDAAVGRTFTPDEERFGGPLAIVISDALWEKRFHREVRAVGQSLRLGNANRTIVGVMPPSFRFPTAGTEVWIPAQAPRMLLEARQARFYAAFGRLKPGATPDQAQRDLSAVQADLGRKFPATDAGWAAAVVPLKEQAVAGVRRSLWLLLAAVALVLLAACWNVACLLVADAARREHEIAVRFAVGATRATVIRQLLIEGLFLALAGAFCALLVARWSIDLLKRAAHDLPRIQEVHVDPVLVVFTFTLGVATTLLFALAPAVQATRGQVAARLSHGGRVQAGGRLWLQRLLVAAQVSLALLLVAGAGLLLRSFVHLQHVAPGFDADPVLTFRMSAQWAERLDAVTNRQLRTMSRLAAIPGVAASAMSAGVPGGADYPPAEFRIAGRDTGEHLFALSRSVSAAYFRTLAIPILQGETCRDDPAKPFERVVVSRSWADRFFPGESPIGHVIEPQSVAGLRQEIVGVVADARESGLMKEPPAVSYTCGLMPYWPDPVFLVRIEPGREVSVRTIRDALREIEPNRAMYAVKPLNETLSQSISQQRLTTMLLGLFAATALALAALGLYGVISQFVAARRREIGVRLALGARPADIVSTIAGQVAVMTLAGIGVGVVSALVLARFMTSLVFGISVRDPWTFAAAPLLMGVVALLASFLPARRAVTLDPMTALRED